MPAHYAPDATNTLRRVTDIPYTVRRSSRARRVRVNVQALADLRSVGVEVVLPGRAPARAAPMDRAPAGRGARGARSDRRPRRHRPLPGHHAGAGPAGAAHARTPSRRAPARAPRRRPPAVGAVLSTGRTR